ncbi:MAG: MATE family efflux transporter [Phycisphaeraceae bacterium]|nr:MATE family efflux transporter [Phycisphaeraceae bacterium]HRJ48989.1 MATE family efflux transporter [Phycisphaerales bacterium]
MILGRSWGCAHRRPKIGFMENANSQPQASTDAGSASIADRPLREMVRLALPVVVAMSSYTVMQSVDKLMVSRIGPDPIYVGVQGNGGLAAWVPISIVIGMLGVINTYVAQNLGNKTPERAPAYAWAGIWLGAGAWLALIPYALLMGGIFEWLGHDAERASMQASYGRVLVLGSILTISARSLSQFFYGMHRPVVVLVAEVAANLTNVVFNSVLIYGPTAPSPTGVGLIDGWFGWTAGVASGLGIPRLGVEGAAIGTVIATVVELAIPAGVFLSAKYNRLYRTRAAWRPSRGPIRDILRIGWPGGAMFGNEMICWAFFMVYLVGDFGTHHSNAGWIAHQWMSLSFMPAVGISFAVTSVVGRCMGAGRPDLAKRRALLGVMLSAGYMGTMGLLFVVFREEMVGLYVSGETVSEDRAAIIRLGSGFMIAAATFQLFDGIAMSISGALRGAGDTVWVGVVTVILAWSMIVAGGLAMVRFLPGLESLGPWIAASGYIIVLSVAVSFRFRSGNWMSIRLVGDRGGAAIAGDAS